MKLARIARRSTACEKHAVKVFVVAKNYNNYKATCAYNLINNKKGD